VEDIPTVQIPVMDVARTMMARYGARGSLENLDQRSADIRNC